MEPFTLYHKYSRKKAISRLPSIGRVKKHSGGELVVKNDVGLLFVEVGQPPRKSHCITNQVLCWITSETDPQFYKSRMPVFRSSYRPDKKPLHFFGKIPTDQDCTYLGVLEIIHHEVPSTGREFEDPDVVIIQFRIVPELSPEVWPKFDWSQAPVLINGLPLPESLARLIVSGRWRTPKETHMSEVFGDHSTHADLCYPDRMERYTNQLRYLYDIGYGKEYAIQVSPDDRQMTDAGDILDISKAISLGDTGPDEPFCLDYRQSLVKPSVVYLTGTKKPYWKTIAPDIETFAKMLDL